MNEANNPYQQYQRMSEEDTHNCLNIVQETRMKEYQIGQGNLSWEQITPAQIVAGMKKLASDIRKGKVGTVVVCYTQNGTC